MAFTSVVFLASAVMIQSISGQCIGGPYGPGIGPGVGPAGPAVAAEALAFGAPGLPGPLGPGPFGSGFCLPGIAASNGGGFAVTSSSPIAPSGLTVQTDSMAIEGPLAVTGQLPFLGVVALEGGLPVIGQGAVSYGCGAGNIGILNEVGPAPIGPAYPNAYELGPGLGYGYNGYPNGLGCGCGPYY